jgi:hypothetical protein
LGEDWIDDPDGLQAVAGSSAPTRTTAYDPGFVQRMFDRLQDRVSRLDGGPASGSGAKWLARVRQELSDDPAAEECLEALDAIAREGQAQVHLCGDYNSGKTSFIKRLLLDSGATLPTGLAVGGNPTTDQVGRYQWEGLVLVDTPGFQSNNARHGEAALAALPEAAALLYLFQPNLVTGRSEALDAVLKGDTARGLEPKLGRTFFIINRADELGPDPLQSPEEYERLCTSKMRELMLALRSRGIEVAASQVFCMASDPHGLVGNRKDVNASAYDRFRAWDGLGPFLQAFRGKRRELLSIGVDVAILEGGMARLRRLEEGAKEQEQRLLAGRTELGRKTQLVQRCISEARLLSEDLRAALDGLCEDHAAALAEEALSQRDEAAIARCIERMKRWWADPAFQVEVLQWSHRAADRIEGWRRRATDLLKRRLSGYKSPRGLGEVLADPRPGDPHPLEQRRPGALLGGASRVLQLIDRAVVRLGRVLGHDVEAAAEISANLSRAVGVLAAAGVVLDTVTFVHGLRAEGARERKRQQLRQYLNESCERVAGEIADGREARPGPLSVLALSCAELQQLERELAGEVERLQAQIELVATRRRRYASLVTSARALLSREDPKGQVA